MVAAQNIAAIADDVTVPAREIIHDRGIAPFHLLVGVSPITAAGLAKISSGLLPVGALLLSSRAPIGYLAIAEVPVAINQGFIGMICDKRVSNVFAWLWTMENMETTPRLR